MLKTREKLNEIFHCVIFLFFIQTHFISLNFIIKSGPVKKKVWGGGVKYYKLLLRITDTILMVVIIQVFNIPRSLHTILIIQRNMGGGRGVKL